MRTADALLEDVWAAALPDNLLMMMFCRFNCPHSCVTWLVMHPRALLGLWIDHSVVETAASALWLRLLKRLLQGEQKQENHHLALEPAGCL